MSLITGDTMLVLHKNASSILGSIDQSSHIFLCVFQQRP